MVPESDHQPAGKSVINTTTSISDSMPPLLRRQSSSASSPQASQHLSPKVQLIPHTRTASFDVALTNAQRDLLDKTNFDHLDLSSQDFDFEEIFTYDKPQRKLPKVVEVSMVVRERNWSSFPLSHYTAAMAARSKVNRNRSSTSEKYMKNQIAQSGAKRSEIEH